MPPRIWPLTSWSADSSRIRPDGSWVCGSHAVHCQSLAAVGWENTPSAQVGGAVQDGCLDQQRSSQRQPGRPVADDPDDMAWSQFDLDRGRGQVPMGRQQVGHLRGRFPVRQADRRVPGDVGGPDPQAQGVVVVQAPLPQADGGPQHAAQHLAQVGGNRFPTVAIGSTRRRQVGGELGDARPDAPRWRRCSASSPGGGWRSSCPAP
jgi:hypothetical protein